jgi:hypothetical protein
VPEALRGRVVVGSRVAVRQWAEQSG